MAHMEVHTPSSIPGDLPDHDIAMSALSSRFLLGADMSECMGRDTLSGIAERVGEVLAVDVRKCIPQSAFPSCVEGLG